jgi:putative NADH-flavin reductase
MSLRLFVVGASGHIGTHLLDLGLARSHQVTAYVRSRHKITRDHPALSVIEAPLATEPLARYLRGHDAVLSSIGPATREALRPSTLMAESAASVVAAMATANVKRLAIVSAAVLFPLRGLGFRFFQWMLRHHARDLVAMESVVSASDFEWTIARPPRLVERADATYRARDGALPEHAASMSFRAVASFLLDTIERREHTRAVVGLAGAV